MMAFVLVQVVTRTDTRLISIGDSLGVVLALELRLWSEGARNGVRVHLCLCLAYRLCKDLGSSDSYSISGED